MTSSGSKYFNMASFVNSGATIFSGKIKRETATISVVLSEPFFAVMVIRTWMSLPALALRFTARPCSGLAFGKSTNANSPRAIFEILPPATAFIVPSFPLVSIHAMTCRSCNGGLIGIGVGGVHSRGFPSKNIMFFPLASSFATPWISQYSDVIFILILLNMEVVICEKNFPTGSPPNCLIMFSTIIIGSSLSSSALSHVPVKSTSGGGGVTFIPFRCFLYRCSCFTRFMIAKRTSLRLIIKTALAQMHCCSGLSKIPFALPKSCDLSLSAFPYI
mmetsp:Transcript_10526/g.12081  ORF Transcript_10526/g.12081 Transcript_10526/m.12081 type:complete len:275 (-) Transcript_10526:1907-2731(-)